MEIPIELRHLGLVQRRHCMSHLNGNDANRRGSDSFLCTEGDLINDCHDDKNCIVDNNDDTSYNYNDIIVANLMKRKTTMPSPNILPSTVGYDPELDYVYPKPKFDLVDTTTMTTCTDSTVATGSNSEIGSNSWSSKTNSSSTSSSNCNSTISGIKMMHTEPPMVGVRFSQYGFLQNKRSVSSEDEDDDDTRTHMCVVSSSSSDTKEDNDRKNCHDVHKQDDDCDSGCYPENALALKERCIVREVNDEASFESSRPMNISDNVEIQRQIGSLMVDKYPEIVLTAKVDNDECTSSKGIVCNDPDSDSSSCCGSSSNGTSSSEDGEDIDDYSNILYEYRVCDPNDHDDDDDDETNSELESVYYDDDDEICIDNIDTMYRYFGEHYVSIEDLLDEYGYDDDDYVDDDDDDDDDYYIDDTETDNGLSIDNNLDNSSCSSNSSCHDSDVHHGNSDDRVGSSMNGYDNSIRSYRSRRTILKSPFVLRVRKLTIGRDGTDVDDRSINAVGPNYVGEVEEGNITTSNNENNIDHNDDSNFLPLLDESSSDDDDDDDDDDNDKEEEDDGSVCHCRYLDESDSSCSS